MKPESVPQIIFVNYFKLLIFSSWSLAELFLVFHIQGSNYHLQFHSVMHLHIFGEICKSVFVDSVNSKQIM